MTESENTTLPTQMDIQQIMDTIPHRYPFLLVDRILEMHPDFIVGQKCVSANEPFFQGHFPGRPVMPGVLMIEAMAQTGAVLAKSQPENKNKLVMLAGINNVRYRRPVLPGDVVRIEVKMISQRRNIGKCQGKFLVEGELACEAEIMWAMVDL